MHGLINRSVEEFLRASGGEALWRQIAGVCGADPQGFQSDRDYPDGLTYSMLSESARVLDCPEGELLEDIGAWICRVEPLRRLLRFSGSDYTDFVLSLDQLPDRVGMVVPKMHLPPIAVDLLDDETFVVHLDDPNGRWCRVVAGILRQMADDYGALAVATVEVDTITLRVPEHGFADGRHFRLIA